MKSQDSVSTIAGAVKLPPSVTTFLQHNKEEAEDYSFVNGGVLQNSRFAWLTNGAKFIVINVVTGHKIASWTFGAILRDLRTKVTCVYELPTPLLEHTMQLLVGLECDLIGGMVCLFHCQGSRVLRAVRVDCRVSCLQYVERLPEGPLQCFDGTVLIGTQGGMALAFDLSRQSCIEAILHANSGQEELIRDELNLADLVVLSIDDIDVIHEQRAIACQKEDHIAIQINEGCFHNLQYIMHNPDNTIRLRATREKVFVTNILYVPQLASVFIAFNFGAFQLWNLITLKLEYTSPPSTDGLPITHFGFLEPCDDPRAFSYLWVVYSSLDRHEEGFPLAAMYALTYEGKTTLNGGGYLYENFITCNLRFNVELSGAPSVPKHVVGGRALACHAITMTTGRADDCDECVLNLCQVVWECWPQSVLAPVQSMMIVFDIDQWYKEQMPDCTVLETNSYLSVVNLGESLAHTASSYLCDVRISADTLTPYYSVPRLEEHFYPNSLGYECFCLTNTDITRLSTMGVQRQILSSINEIGPSVLLQPTKLFQQCVSCGLLPLYVEPTPVISTSILTQRQTILSIALEARLIHFLSACARDWATGGHSSAGCSLAVLTRWAWARALCLKGCADRLTMPLFDHAGEAPDGNAARCLESCTRQLAGVASLLGSVAEKCEPLMLPEAIKEVKLQQKAVQVVALYFQVVQWFLNVGLLPEFSTDHPLLEENNERLPYPVDSLVRYYQNRRYKLHCLNGENPALENLQDKFCPLLFIDQFIRTECTEDKLKMFWMDDGSKTQGLYPPPSLHSLLRIYLIPEIKEEYKHYLVLYVLVDYVTTFDDSRHENIIRRLMQFPTMFGFSNTGLKITEAFWHLDHRGFDFALVQLQSLLAGGSLKQWQHNVVLSSLLAQKKTQSALQYLHVRNPYATILAESGQNREAVVFDDWQVCCNLYLSRGLVLEAFNLIKESLTEFDSSDEKAQRLLVFLEGCQKMGLLSKALLLPFSRDEEEILTNFLKAFGDSESNNLLVMYYLQRSRYIEAQQVNEDLKHLSCKGQLPYDVTSDFSMKKDHVPKTKTRNDLVDLYCKTLPKITRFLSTLTGRNSLGKKMLMPTPMTVNLQAVVPKPAEYKSSIIQATINKANETWMDRPTVARGLKRALQVEETPFICTPKMARHASRLCQVEKMNTTPPDDSFQGTPPKRPRLNSSEDPQLDQETLAQDPRLKEEVEALLHTPIVERKSYWRCGSRASGRSSVDRTSVREATPQSILKVRKLLESAASGLDERQFAETDDELETASQHTQSDNLSRSIRFNIPSAGNTPSPSMSPSDFNEDYDFPSIRLRSRASGFGLTVSPRKGIHNSRARDDRQASISPSAVVSTPIKKTPPRGRNLLSARSSARSSFSNQVDDLCYSENVPVCQNMLADYMTAASDPTPSVKTDEEEEDSTMNADKANIHTPQDTDTDSESTINQASTEKSYDVRQDVVNRDDGDGSKVELEPMPDMSSSPVIQCKGPQPRRSLRNTPERSISKLVQSPDTRRSLRSRTRTPEPISQESISKPRQSPAKHTPIQSRAKMSLARMVVEANAYSKNSSIPESSVSKEEFTSHSVSITQTKESTQSSVTNFSMSNNSWLTDPEAFKDASNIRITPVEQSSKEHSSSFIKESFSTTRTITSSALSSPFNSQDHNSSRLSNLSRLLYLQNESLLASDVSDTESEVSDVEPIIISSKPSTVSPEKTSSSDHSKTALKLVHKAISETDVSVKSSTEHFAPLGTQDETSRDEEIKLDSISSTVTTHEDVSVIVKINIEVDPLTSAEDSVETPSTAKEVHITATAVYNDDSNSNGLVIDTECERNESEKDMLEVESIGEGSLLHSDLSDAEENKLESDNENDIDLNEPTTQHSWQTISQDSKEAKSSQYSSQVSGEKTEEEKESDDSNGSSNHTAANSDHENEHDDWESESNDEVVKRAVDMASESSEEDDEPNEDSEVDSDAENLEGDTSDSSASNDDLFIEESSEDAANKAYVDDAGSEVITIASSDDEQSKPELKVENVLKNEAGEFMEAENDLPTDVEMEEPIQSIVQVDVAIDLLADEENKELKISVEEIEMIETPSSDLENIPPESLPAHSGVEKSAPKNESVAEEHIPALLEVEKSVSNNESIDEIKILSTTHSVVETSARDNESIINEIKTLPTTSIVETSASNNKSIIDEINTLPTTHSVVETSASNNESIIDEIKTMSTESNVGESASKTESVDKKETLSTHSVADKSVCETIAMPTQSEKSASTNEAISEKETIPTLSEVEKPAPMVESPDKKEISVAEKFTPTNETVCEKQSIPIQEGEISASKSESAGETKTVPIESDVGKLASKNETLVEKSLLTHFEVEKSAAQNQVVCEKDTLPNHSEVKSDLLETKIPAVEVNKTMTREEFNNLSLMTEDGSLLEDNSEDKFVSLKYSDDESEGEQTVASKRINNNADAIIIDTNLDTESVAERVESAAVNNDNNNLEHKTNVDMVIEDAVQHSTPTKDNKDKNIDLDETIVEEKMLVDPIISEQRTLSTPQRKHSKRRSSVSSRQSIDKLSESAEDLDTSIAMSTRSASKRKLTKKDPDDDTLSVVSNASSRRSLTLRSESKLDTSFCSDLPAEGGEQSASSLRKSRRSVLAFANTNLSIIPEISHVESDKSHLDKTDSSRAKDLTATQSSILEYSASRRLTRHQRSMLERSMDSPRTPGRLPTRAPQRRSSIQSSEGTIHEEDTESEASEMAEPSLSHRKNLTGKTIDPIQLLDKKDFQGEPDLEEIQNFETASVTSVTSSVAQDFPTTVRGKRASSEIGVKDILRTRRPSLDVAGSPMKTGTPLLDESITDSGGRPRRQSFNKAIEALSTPKRRRRPSTDSKGGDGASVSDNASDQGTPILNKEIRMGDANTSKLLAIEEDEDGEDKGEPSPAKPIRKSRKAASVHGYMMSPDVENAEEIRKARKARMSQLLTPISKEDKLNMEDLVRPRFRRRTGSKVMNQPLQVSLKKK